MQFPGMTTRRWMVVVAMVAMLTAIGVEVYRLFQLRSAYQERAFNFATMVSQFESIAKDTQPRLRGTVILEVEGKERSIEISAAALMSHYVRLKEKYERASRQPWLPIPPDPPPEPD